MEALGFWKEKSIHLVVGVGCPHISKHLAIGLGRKTVPRKQILKKPKILVPCCFRKFQKP